MDVEQIAVDIRDTVRDIPKIYEANNEKIGSIQGEINDLMHLLELSKFNAYEGFKIAKELQLLLQERRQLKNQNEQLQLLEPAFNQWTNKVHALDKAIGDIRNKKNVLANRNYKCRVRTDLEDKINGR